MTTNALRALAWTLVATIVILSLVPPSLRPVTGAPREFEHLAIFASCGLAFGLGYRAGHALRGAALVAFSGVIEVLQCLAPARHARVSDFMVDAMGSCAGILLAWILLKIPKVVGTIGKL